VATIDWAGARAVIRDVCCRADDDAIVSVIDRADKTGIDCPFGWPDAFVHFVAAHHSGHASLPRSQTGARWRQELTMRRTDTFVHDKLRITPLSVSADKIAHVALRWRSPARAPRRCGAPRRSFRRRPPGGGLPGRLAAELGSVPAWL
jgi:hypothetical protein